MQKDKWYSVHSSTAKHTRCKKKEKKKKTRRITENAASELSNPALKT